MFSDDYIVRSDLIAYTCLYVCATISLWNVLYICIFVVSHNNILQSSMLIFRYDKYCLRYGLLVPQLGLVDCNSRWARDVNNAIAARES